MILPAYVIWHYSTAYTDLIRLWTNYIWFFYNFFSISILAKTLFSPWQRITERRQHAGLDFEDIAEVVVINVLMRVVGFIVRTVFIVLGLLTVFIVFWLGIFLLLVWTFLPAIIPVSFVYGISILL